MAKIILIKTLRDEFKFISSWERMLDPDFKRKNYVLLNCSQELAKKYMFKNTTLELEYIVSKNFLSYSPDGTIYNITDDDLYELVKNEKYHVLNFPKNFNFKDDILFIINKLLEKNYTIIPLEDKIYIKTTENIELSYKNQDLISIELSSDV